MSEGGSDYEGEGCNELAALRRYRNVACLHCDASILTVAEMDEEERRE